MVLSVTDVNQLLLWKLTSTRYINFVSDELDASLNRMLERYGLRAGPMRDCMRNLGAAIIGPAALAFVDREHYFAVPVLDISVPYSAFEGMVLHITHEQHGTVKERTTLQRNSPEGIAQTCTIDCGKGHGSVRVNRSEEETALGPIP